jgi:tetratricopeptide (TPR) repeat protein
MKKSWFQTKSALARNLAVILLSFSGLVVEINYSVVAKGENSQPLAIPQHDPLLPPSNIERELSPLEKKRIKAEIARLETEAQEKFAQNQQEQAFKLWFRQLRLYRAISQQQEIITLGRVGAIAWQANLTEELKVISQRLNDIERQLNAQNKLTKELLTALGTSYQEVRYLDKAIAVYYSLLVQARQADDWEFEQKYLATLGELYLSKFDYVRGAIVYEELLKMTSNSDSKQNLDLYLSQLIKIYSYTGELKQAIVVKKQLIDYYLAQNNNEQIGALKISLGDDYQSIGEINLAVKSYREASKLGQSLQQLALTAEALEKLGSLYQKQQQYPLAIQIYQQLLDVETRAYNSYGVVTSYECLGQLYLLLKDYEQALTTFSQGLKVAQELNYQVSYFTELIDRVERKISNYTEEEKVEKVKKSIQSTI